MVVSTQLSEKLIRHASDNNKFIMQVETGRTFAEAVDEIPCKFTYIEADKEIPKRETKFT